MEVGGSSRGRAAAGEEDDALLLPSEVNTAAQGHGLEVFRDKLTVHYKGEGRHNTDVGSIQADRPVPLKRSMYYYEITVLESGEHGRIAIGFTDKNFKLNKQPGWDPDSFGYHGDDGKKFGGTAKGEDYGPKFGKGDTIGAAYNLTQQEIFFTKNGNRLRTAFRNVRGELFPTVGLHSKGEIIRINFGQTPFKFDIEALVSEERAAQAAAIDRVPVGTQVVHQMVRQYLLHYGYGDTLKSFDAEAGDGDGGAASLEPAAQQTQDMQTDAAAGDDNGTCSMAVDQEPQDRPEAGAVREPACNGSDMCTDSCGPSSHAAEAAEVWEGDWSRDWALPVRQFVRRAIMRGDVQAAVNCISRAYPQVVLGGAGFDTVRFHLATQQYIELVRAGSIESAVSFAQTTLAALLRTGSGAGAGPSSSLPSSSSAAAPGATGSGSFPQAPPGADMANEAALRDVVALVAYEHPEQSPLAWLLGQEQRERVADAANAALLKQAYGSDPEALKMQSRVEQLLRQLLAVQETAFELNGNQGEAFHLGERILA